MARSDVLVSADWAEENLATPQAWSSSRSTRTPPPTTVATSPEPSSSTGRPTCKIRSAATSSTRSSSRPCCRPKRHRQRRYRRCSTAETTTGSPPTPTGTSSCTATRMSSCSTAERKKWDFDGRELSQGRRPAGPATSYTGQGAGPLTIRAFRDEVVAAIGQQNLIDVRSPDEFSGKLLAPAHLPQEQSQRGGHIPTAPQRPVEQGGQRRRHVQVRRRPAQALRRRGRSGRRAKDTIAYCRIGERSSAHLVRVARAAGLPQGEELRRLVGPIRFPGRASRSRRDV